MKRRLLFASLAASLVAVAAFAGTVLAQEATEDEGESLSVYERAAEILGVTEDELRGAFEQAQRDIAQEQINSHIDALVEDGVLTEEEGTELREWLEARPDAAEKVVPFGGMGFVPRGPGGHFGHRGPILHFRVPPVEGGVLPPDGAFFERFETLRDERGFGIIDGKGFRFEWFGPGEDDDEAEVTPTPTPEGEGVSV